MKKILIAVGILIVILIFSFSGESRGSSLLSDTAAIQAYRISDVFTPYAFAEISFKEDFSYERYVNIVADMNKDGAFSDNEWIVKNERAIIAKEYPNRFSFTRPQEMENGEFPLSVGITGSKIASLDEISDDDRKEFIATVDVTDIVEQFGLNVPGASEDLKRGVGLFQIAYADDFNAGISGTIPDLTGGPMDCFAIATANNLIKMTDENGRRGDLPVDPQAIITELKQDMQYNNGILNPNFMSGKHAYVTRYNLPITTREIKRPTKQDIEDAFTDGDAVEISTTMIRSSSGQANTGHVLTGVGAAQDGSELGIAVHDPATPTGADTFLVSETGGANPYLMINYPLWDGIVLIDAIYIQTWNQTANGAQDSSATGTNGSDSKAAVDGDKKGTNLGVFNDGEAMVVIEYNGTYIPVEQLRVGESHPPHSTGPGCPARHWHADAPVTALNGTIYPDPLSGGCGFGTLEEKPIMNYFPHGE